MEHILQSILKLVVKLSFATALIVGMFLSAYLAVTQFDRTGDDPSIYDYIVIASAIGLALTFLMLSLKLNFKDSGTSNTPLTQNHPATNKKGVSMGVFDKKRDLIKTLSEEDIRSLVVFV